MESRTFHKPVTAAGLVAALAAHFDEGHITTRVQVVSPTYSVVHIDTIEMDRGGRRRTALSINVVQKDEFVEVSFDEQDVLGPAGDLLGVGLRALRNPLTAIGRLADVADDLETLSISESVWKAVEHYAANAREPEGPRDIVICPYCMTANKVGVLKCPACGAPLGDVQPRS